MIELSPATALLTGTVCYWAYYLTHYGKKPELHHKKGTKFDSFLENHVPKLKIPYWSFFWVPGGKLQTIVASLLPVKYNVEYTREAVMTSDGGQFTLAWANKEEGNQHSPVVVILPGLVSTSETGYIKCIVDAVLKKGHRAVVVVNRGLELPCLTGKAFCATHTSDFEQAMEIIKQRNPNIPVMAIGVSLGSLILGRYLSIKQEKSQLQAAFLYSCPFDTVRGSASIEKWDNWLLYNIVLTNNLKQIYIRHKEKFEDIVDHTEVMGSRSIREVDMHFTSKVFGYESVDHYYQDSRLTAKRLQSIQIPTLCLCANDDAFIPDSALPRNDVKETEYVALAVTSGGGHVSHLSGANPFTTPYYIDVISDYMTAVFEHGTDLH
uniref:Phospholipase ABHD3 n=1 Tax=Ciona intestinalis TaxID=7719 RepID=F6Z010_CIOIN|nr:phospholipase ABHD3 [Ciona intestinalis]|eukprot:XP_002127021.1 phospholipase ABHD3 [Ciona intestinalis]